MFVEGIEGLPIEPGGSSKRVGGEVLKHRISTPRSSVSAAWKAAISVAIAAMGQSRQSNEARSASHFGRPLVPAQQLTCVALEACYAPPGL